VTTLVLRRPDEVELRSGFSPVVSTSVLVRVVC